MIPVYPRRPTPLLTRTIAVLVALVWLASACTDEGSAAGTPTVVATTSIWADVAGSVTCGGPARVEALIPAGADPHGYELSLADRRRLETASLVVANGFDLEEGIGDTLSVVEDGGTPVFRIAEHVDTLPFASQEPRDRDADHHEHDEDEDGHDGADAHHHTGDDPHIWFDPHRVAEMLPALGAELVEHLSLDPDAVDACIATYRRELRETDEAIAAMIDRIPPERRKLITTHDFLGYFADRYDLEVIETVIGVPSGLGETNPAHLEEVADLMTELGISAVLADGQRSTDDAEALASAVEGAQVVRVRSGSLGEAGTGADTYLGFLVTNATAIATALG